VNENSLCGIKETVLRLERSEMIKSVYSIGTAPLRGWVGFLSSFFFSTAKKV